MKAIIFNQYGAPEVLQVTDVETPIPNAGEVQIKIKAIAVNTGDCEMRRAQIPNVIWFLLRLYIGLFKPRKKILGSYFSGVITATGKNVSRFAVGDEVMVCSGPSFGAYAEFICLGEEEAIVKKPINMSFVGAAALPLGIDALHFLRMANVKQGQKVLVNGAGGAIGTIAVQLAKYYGAEVTAVDTTQKLPMLNEIGADETIDFTKQDFAAQGNQYDVIFDLVGKKMFRKSLQSLTPQGCYLLTNPTGLSQLLRGGMHNLVSRKKVISKFASASPEYLSVLKELVDSRTITSVVDKTYPFHAVIEAHRYVESGMKKGSIVLTVNEE